LKGKVYRAKQGLKKLGAINAVPGAASKSTAKDSPNADFLREVMEFIETEVEIQEHLDEDDDGDQTNKSQGELTLDTTALFVTRL